MSVSQATRDREQDKLYVTDAELIRRIGVPLKLGRRVLGQLDRFGGFPAKQEMWGWRRYWPHVQEWLERSSDMFRDDAARLIPENRARTRSPRQSSLRHPHAEGSRD